MLEIIIFIPLFFYQHFFGIIIGFSIGVLFFAVLGAYFNSYQKKDDLTAKFYDSLLNSIESENKDEDDKKMLLKMSPKEFENPMQLLSELVRRKTALSQTELPRFERNLTRTPPRELLEPREKEPMPGHLKPEIFYVLKALEGLEFPLSWTLDPKDVEILSVDEGTCLLQPGESNDTILVVVSGELGVFTKMYMPKEEIDFNIKHVGKGLSYFSTTSIIECLMDTEPINRYLTIRTMTQCRIAKYRLNSLHKSFIQNPKEWVRTIQVVMTRLQHCTLYTCNIFLGIGGKCINRKRKIPDKTNYAQFETMSDNDLLIKGAKEMADAMGIPEHVDKLCEKVKVFKCAKGAVVTEENSFDIDLIFVIFGQLNLSRSQKQVDDTGCSLTFNVWPGDMLPSMQILTNEPTMLSATAVKKTIYLKLPRDDFIEFLALYPRIYLRLAYHALHFTSPFARVFDQAVTWIRIDTGQALFRAGDASDCMYIVMGGRLRAVEPTKIIEEYGRLDVIGIVDMAEKKVRKATVLAVRFSHLVCISDNLITFVKSRYPQVATKLIQLISQCWRNPNPLTQMSTICQTPKIQNLRTIAIVPACHDVPLTAFACELYNSLTTHVKALRLSSYVIRSYFDPKVVTKKLDFALMHWLTVQEISYSLIIYQCDYEKTNWTRRCLRMADAILVVALGNRSKSSQKLADSLLKSNEKGIRQSKELVLLWSDDTKSPKGTSTWMREAYYCGYHHLRAPSRVFKFKTVRNNVANENEVVEYYEKNVFGYYDSKSDFARLARILTGNAIGVVFGGGGSRGAAHAGALRAILEKNIPIDMVGGTSIGALFGSLYATTPDLRAVERMKEFFTTRNRHMVYDVLRDLTWAHSAILTGHTLNLAVQHFFNDATIEDSWISFFCITTDITTSTMRVHRSGIMWPVIRGSMSIAGYLPPVCDPIDGHLLVDGAYVNNLPADVMRSQGANVVIAIDVGMADDSSNLTNYGYSLSGTWVLFKKWWPFGEPIRVLNMNEIQNRLAFVCCVHQLEAVKKSPWCHYIKLPIEGFPIFDFSQFDKASRVGYEHTVKKLEEIFENNPATRKKLLGRAMSVGPAANQVKNEMSPLVNLSMMPTITSSESNPLKSLSSEKEDMSNVKKTSHSSSPVLRSARSSSESDLLPSPQM